MGVFRQVVALWLAPDFALVEAGKRAAPWVNHDEVNMAEFSEFLEKFNRCGENVRVRIPDDTVDQVTVHFRLLGRTRGPVDCTDFADALLTAARGRKPLIAVRAAWSSLHHMRDRTAAPPPVLILFVVEGTFEGVMIWLSQLSMRCGIKAADPMTIIDGKAQEEDHHGKLPRALSTKLEELFGIAYLPHCLIGRLACSPVPEWAQGRAEGRRSR